MRSPIPVAAEEPGSAPQGRTSHIVVAVGGRSSSERLVREGKRLADALGCSWEAVHVETPEARLADDQGTAQLLARAAELGASIASFPASDAATGLSAHIAASPADILVLGRAIRTRRLALRRRTIIDRIDAPSGGPTLVVVPCRSDPDLRAKTSPLTVSAFDKSTPRAHGTTLLLVAVTLLLALSLQRFAGARVLDLLFLFPVITAAAQSGLRPALTAAITSVLAYNFFLTEPHYSFGLKTPQSLLMAIVLTTVAVYTSIVTGRLRARLQLSDRSASENARLAAFGQSLAVAADWEDTAQIVCDEVAALLHLQAAVLREKDGQLAVAAATPGQPTFSPIDRAALDWCWANGAAAGSGTDMLPATDWQFQPLKTSLGMLAVLAIARTDGRDPVRADRAVLLATIVSQAALAHERLRLEDQMREGR